MSSTNCYYKFPLVEIKF